MRIFVLGAGAAGALLARLLERQGHTVWCGDRDLERARRSLPASIPCRGVNARNLWGIVRAARSCHLLVNAAPAAFNHTVLRAALRLRAHYFDMATHLGRYPFKAEQLRFHKRFLAKRRLALINAGAAPGLTNLLVARAADELDRVEQVQIRLFEHTESEDPVSTWSAETAFDEATSPPRIYRQGRFRLARRFSEPEWFHFPPPIGRARGGLVAQDEAGTLPYFIPMRELDVKIGGNEIDRGRGGRFPQTPTHRQVARLIRRGILSNARFALAVVVRGEKRGEPLELRWYATFPTLYQIRLQGLPATPIAYATAHTAALFIKHFPRTLRGVHPPEALPAELRRRVLAELKTRAVRITSKTRRLKKPEDDEEL